MTSVTKTNIKEDRSKKADMLSGPILPGLFKFAVPIILSGLLQQLYSTADTLIVGAMGGKEALAAVGATGSTVSLLVTVFVSIFVGTDLLVARAKGNGDEDSLRKAVATTYLISLIFGIFLLVAGELLARPMMLLTGCPDNIIDRATLYLRIYFLAMPGSMFVNFASSVIRSSGNSRAPFVYLSISGFCNVLGNVILVLTIGDPVCAVAIATTLSVYISALLFFIHLVRDKSATGLKPFKLSFHAKTFGKIVRYGIPSAISSTTFTLTNLIFQPIINSYGDNGISGTSAAAAIEGYLFIITAAIGTSVATFMGQNIGAGNRERVKKVLIRGYILNISFALLFTAVALAVGRTLLGFFIPGEIEAIEFGYLRIKIVIGFSFLNAISNVNKGAMQSYGYTFVQMLTNVIGISFLSILWAIFIYPLSPSALTFLINYPVTWVITASFLLVFVTVLTKRYLKGEDFKL